MGLVMAAGFWILTQLNVIWTKNALSKRVIKASAETKQQAIDTVLGMEKRLDAKISALEELEMPEINQEALIAAIGPEVSRCMEMAFHQVEAQQAKRVGAFLKDMDLEGQLGELEEGVRAQAMEALPAQAQVLMDVMNTKIPKSATITEKALLNVSKAVCAQLLQGGLASIAPQRAVEQAAVSTGFGVRSR